MGSLKGSIKDLAALGLDDEYRSGGSDDDDKDDMPAVEMEVVEDD